MTKIVCEECRKSYDYEKDDFCPRCGAYNQPRRTSGATVRVDGVNESGHTGSFAHQEVHTEKAMRRSAGLDRPKPTQKPPQGPPAARRTQPAASQSKRAPEKTGASVIAVVVWIIILIQFLRLILEF